MSTTQPFKNLDEIEGLKKFFCEKGELRNYALVTMGINTALRISDLLKLQWKDVWNFQKEEFRMHVLLTEQKTGKNTVIYLNQECLLSLSEYKQSVIGEFYPELYIFKSRTGENNPISRNRAYVIIRKACEILGYEGNLSCHSLRKTFGYHAWRGGISPALIMSIYNHSSMDITKRYLAIDQDDKDDAFKKICL